MGVDVTGYPVDEADGWRLVPCSAEWMDDPVELASRQDKQPPPDPEHDPGWCPDPEDPALPFDIDTLRAESRRLAAEQAAGQPLDVAPGGSVLLGLAEHAAGDDYRFTGASDDELIGITSALDRTEAAACSLKHAAAAELIRRRPAPGCVLEGPARMPAEWEDSAAAELSYALAEYRGIAQDLLGRAYDLETKLPGTKAAFRSGIVGQYKAEIICRATALLDPAEARAAEALVLDRAGRLTPAGLRSAITSAAMEVAPDKAKKRREEAAKKPWVERRPELSGNAVLLGRELPPAKVLAADQRITWWARELKKAGITGTTDQLRAQAYLDLLLNLDSRPAAETKDGESGTLGNDGSRPPDWPTSPGHDGSGPPHPARPPAPPGAGVIPAGFASRLNLTVPLTILLGLAGRPGEIPGLGPLDPWLARDLARAAAQNPQTTWCLTVTDQQGHAIGHGCARPEPENHSQPTKKQQKRRSPGGHDPPCATGNPEGPEFAFRTTGQPGPPGGYGSWRFTTGIPGRPGLIIALDPIAIETCDHRFEAAGHDPGVKLRHLAEIRHATCRRPASRCDFEHNTRYEAGGRSCMCNGGPKCRHEHRLKQDPRWNVEQVTPGTFRWTTPSRRTYTTGPTRHTI